MLMVLGLSIETFTIVHVIISLVAIASGLVVLAGMFGSHRLTGWTAFFLIMTILTSVTGFMFPIHGFTPALGTGIVSMVLLAIALVALYRNHLSGAWRWIFVVVAIAALWVNVFVLIVQAFLKVPALHALAPNGNEPPFLIAQAVALIAFVVLGALAAIKFRPVLEATRS
jgi:hypothetical protein